MHRGELCLDSESGRDREGEGSLGDTEPRVHNQFPTVTFFSELQILSNGWSLLSACLSLQRFQYLQSISTKTSCSKLLGPSERRACCNVSFTAE